MSIRERKGKEKQGISSVVGVTLAMSRSLVRFEHHLISVHDPLGSSGQGSKACFYFLLQFLSFRYHSVVEMLHGILCGWFGW